MEFRLILATIFILTKQPNQNPHQAQPYHCSTPGVKMESSCQSGCRHDPSSFYPEQPGFLTRERKLSDQPTNGTDIAGSMGSLPATATRCPDTFSAKEMVSPSLRGIVFCWSLPGWIHCISYRQGHSSEPHIQKNFGRALLLSFPRVLLPHEVFPFEKSNQKPI